MTGTSEGSTADDDFLNSNLYDREGKPITVGEWSQLLLSNDYKRVAEDKIGDKWISTVWIGLDHSTNGSRLIFETMIFAGDGADSKIVDGPFRYQTLEAARAGHEWAVGQEKRRKWRENGES